MHPYQFSPNGSETMQVSIIKQKLYSQTMQVVFLCYDNVDI
jgi:hypothetical protein